MVRVAEMVSFHFASFFPAALRVEEQVLSKKAYSSSETF